MPLDFRKKAVSCSECRWNIPLVNQWFSCPRAPSDTECRWKSDNPGALALILKGRAYPVYPVTATFRPTRTPS